MGKINENFSKLVEKITDCPAEFSDIVNNNFWDLIDSPKQKIETYVSRILDKTDFNVKNKWVQKDVDRYNKTGLIGSKIKNVIHYKTGLRQIDIAYHNDVVRGNGVTKLPNPQTGEIKMSNIKNLLSAKIGDKDITHLCISV